MTEIPFSVKYLFNQRNRAVHHKYENILFFYNDIVIFLLDMAY